MFDYVSPQSVNPRLRDKMYRDRLYRSVAASWRSLDWTRNFYRRMLREYVGPTYGEGDDDRKIKYLNKSSQFINAHVMTLAGSDPMVDVGTNYQHLSPFARNWSVNLNALMKRIKIKDQIQEWIFNGLVLVGYMKIHYADSGHVIFENDIEADPGIVYASSLSIEDYVFDNSVKKEGRCAWSGDKFRMAMMDLERGLDLGMFDEEAAENIHPTSKLGYDRDRSDAISNSQETDDDELHPKFDAIDIYDYEDRVIRTYAIADTRTMQLKGKHLSEVEWRGLETGPYHSLRFFRVPDNIMPKSPLGDIEAMERFVNNLARKTARKAYNQKDVTIYTPAGKTSMQNINDAKDLESVMVTSIQDVDVIKTGGVDTGTLQTLGNFLGLIDEQAGNLKQMLGLAASAGTLGQEQIIQQAGTKTSSFLEQRIDDEMRPMLENISLLMWADDFMTIQSSIEVDTLGPKPEIVDSSWRPGDREGDPSQYSFNLVKYSMRARTPAETANLVLSTIERVYLPLQEHLMAQGGIIDVFELNEMLADKTNTPEFRKIITFAGAQAGGPPTPQMGSSKSPVSHRNYTRRSVRSPESSAEEADRWNIQSDTGQQRRRFGA